MNGATASGVAGLAVSLLAHGAAAALLVAVMRPDPVEDQPPPAARMTLATAAVDRRAARQAEADAAAAPEAAAETAALSAGAPPRRSAVSQPAPLRTTAAVPPAGTVAPEATPAARIATAGDPEAAVLAPLTPHAEPSGRPVALPAQTAPEASMPNTLPARPTTPASASASVVSPEGSAVADAEPRPILVAARDAEAAAVRPSPARPRPAPPASAAPRPAEVRQPTEIAAPTAARASTVVAPSPPVAVAAPTDKPQGPRASQRPVPAMALRAATAFEGFEDVTDPQSLAALETFLAPTGAAAETEVRDSLSRLLASVPCARLQAIFRPESGTLELHGHVPEDGAADPVLAALRAEMGTDIPVTANLRVLPEPQCAVLNAAAAAGLPQSTDQITNPRLVGPDTHAREFSFRAGEALILDLAAPDYPAYLYVDYFDAAGQVVHLTPTALPGLVELEAKDTARVGAPAPGAGGLYIEIGPPYGLEVAIAFAASAPLFDTPRPLVEPAGPYLDALTARIAERRAADPGFRGEWVYFLVRTSP